MHKEWCGRSCCDCQSPCRLDEQIPCSPDCENITETGYIKVKRCLEAGCDEIWTVLDMTGKTDEEILEKFGSVAKFPY